MASTIQQPKAFAWSYSALKNFETCQKRYLHYNIRKDVVEPETPQLAEGNALHKHFADRLSKGAPLPLGYGMHEPLLARIAAAPGALVVEQKLAITAEFRPATYFARDVWFRTVVDAGKTHEGRCTVFDWKTGKQVSDDTQLALMAATIMAHDPSVQRVKAALVYVNHGGIEQAEYTRDSLVEIWNDIIPRVRAIEKAAATQTYHPKPSGLCRRYCAVVSCPYHGKGG